MFRGEVKLRVYPAAKPRRRKALGLPTGFATTSAPGRAGLDTAAESVKTAARSRTRGARVSSGLCPPPERGEKSSDGRPPDQERRWAGVVS